MTPARDPAVSIARGLGIILVVLGHCFDPFSWYPIYSYHMALFFLLAGYVFNPRHREDPKRYALARAKRLLAPYFLYNLLFAGLTALAAATLGLWTDLAPFSLRALVYEPLTTGHQFPLFNGGWFLVTLFFVQLAYLPLPRLLGGDGPARELAATGLLALVCVLVGKGFDLSPLGTQVGKIGFGLFFYACGRRARSWDGLSGLVAARGETASRPAGLLVLLGDNTVPIMCLHLLFFFLLNALLIPLADANPAMLGNTLFAVNAPRLYPLYVAAGLFGPIAAVKLARAAASALARRHEAASR